MGDLQTVKEHNLLIVGAGVYGTLVKEIAQSMGCFDKIAFIDDVAKKSFGGEDVIGTVSDIAALSSLFSNVSVAIGNPDVRLSIIGRIEAETPCAVVSLVSPLAYVSAGAEIAPGCIIEPMAVIHTGCKLLRGCIVSAGAVINHASSLGEGVHVDCNATVAGYADVPSKMKVPCGNVFLG